MRIATVLILAGIVACAGGEGPSGVGMDSAIGDEPDAGSGDPGSGPGAQVYESIAVDERGFVVNGEYTILRGGTVQWFRMPEEVWDDRLRRFKAAGFNTIEMYVAWNHHEAEEGVFDFETYDLAKFLDLAVQHGLFVYFRPGPYITNELDGGGVPAWMFTRTTKKSRNADGKPNLRTNDPDYLDYVERYFDALNDVVRPYLITNGGPIILYSIENEYDWFEMFFRVDKLFWFLGGTERAVGQDPDTRGYLAALRDIVLADGIDVPLTTCPGSAKVAGMGDVEGVIPMPNIYIQGGTEDIAFDIVTSMHDPQQFGGAYTEYPSGTTETDRTATRLKRVVMGGMDGAFHFNVVGFSQSGYTNAVVLNNAGPSSIFDLDLDRVMSAFVSPTVGYFSGVIDYFGAIGPSGVLRAKFWDFRRTNMFFDAFEARIGAVKHPQVGDPRVRLEHHSLAADYWLDTGDGVYFVGVVNESAGEQLLPVGALTVDGAAIPRYVPMTVPHADYPGAASDGGTELEYSAILAMGVPLVDSLSLDYSTAEILTLRDLGGAPLLAVFGVEGAEGELAFDGDYTVVDIDGGIDNHGDAFTFRYGEPKLLTVESGADQVRVLVLTRHDAGRAWFHGDDYLVVGPDYVTGMRVTDGGALDVDFDHDGELVEVFALTPAGARRFDHVLPGGHPSLPDTLRVGAARSDIAEAAVDLADDAGWYAWTGDPMPLEELGIFRGHAWYRAEFDIDMDPEDRWLGWRVWVDHASDIVGIYVNGHYLTTLAPLGTEIDGRSLDGAYSFPDPTPYLVRGRNVIAFRVEVWGHGSFMWPRGNLIGSRAALPSLGFDAVKGLWGKAEVGNARLTNWQVRPELGGERAGWPTAPAGAAWTDASIPMQLDRGDVRWYRTTLRTTDLPDPSAHHAPAVLHLEGQNTKATIYLNGRLIGRWLSDEAWLRRGTWARGIRNMWMNTNPDDIPVPIELLRSGDNDLVIAFEDTSGDDQPGGRIDALRLRYNQEVKSRDDAGNTAAAEKLSHRSSLRVE